MRATSAADSLLVSSLDEVRRIIRACLEAGILDPDRAHRALEIADDRNLTVHTYNEPLARTLAAKLPGHARLLREWLDRLAS